MLTIIILSSFFGSFALAWGLNWLSLASWRRSTGKHWTERARLLYPAMQSRRGNPCGIALIIGLSLAFGFGIMAYPFYLTGFAASWLGASLGGYKITQEAFPHIGFKTWFRQEAYFSLFRFSILGVLVGAALTMPEDFGWETWLLAAGVLGFIFAMNFGLMIFLLHISKLIHPSGALLELAQASAREQGVTVKAAWVYPHPVAFAMAYPTTREVIFSSGILERLSADKVAAIMAHEVAHLTESRWSVALRLCQVLSLYLLIFVRPIAVQFGPIGVGTLCILFFTVLLVMSYHVRKMERRADKHAVAVTTDPITYACALEQMHQINQMPVVMPRGLRRTHPDTYDRMQAAGYQPDYPRPAKPPANWVTRGLLIISLALWIALVIYASKSA